MKAENNEKPRISVKNLNFFYGKTKALKDINLDIAEKKVTAFIGPSGCGKDFGGSRACPPAGVPRRDVA